MQSKQSLFLRNRVVIGALALLVFLIGGYYLLSINAREDSAEIAAVDTETAAVDSTGIKAVVYKSPTCSCCLGHAGYLEGEGFDVDTVVEQDIASVKQRHNIPYDMQSCHTTEIDGYFVEGHVPVEAVNKLLTERPEIDGITLPDMPAGSPGMPGAKREEFVIYALKDGQASEFMRI